MGRPYATSSSCRSVACSSSPAAEADLLLSKLQQQGITPAPGLSLHQLRRLADQATGSVPQLESAAPAGYPQTRTREEKGQGSRAPRKLLWLNGKPPRLAPTLTITAAPG
ncbi:hypothetical protein NQZ68_029380 [Dissostichus eleginoides]|nr:hypothetical protein NQZ68_029380 [Dissostichus eleginoides]